ncbi:MAG TPA: cytochrome P450 [Candidatus Dormibacteraeota bacterium]
MTAEEGKRRRPPGPRGSLLLGSAPVIARDPLAAYQELAHEYGDIVRIRFVLWPTYLLFHPDHVRHVLQEKHTNYSKDLYTYRMLRPVVGNGLLTNDGADWLRQRRLIQPAFHRQRLARVGDLAVASSEAMLEEWSAFAREGRPVDISAEMLRMTLQVAAQALFSVDLSAEDQRVTEAFAAVNELLTDYVHSPIPPFAVPTRRSLRLRAARATLDRLVTRIITTRRREPGGGDVLSMLLLARDEETGEGMDDRQVRDEVMTLLFGGHETTATALTWACYLLALNPQCQDQIRTEVSDLGRPGAEDLPRLTYTRMVLEETLRLFPPAWSFGRKAIRDDEVGGYAIPAGSLVWVCPFVTHRDPRFWERPETFEPERFAPERAASRHRLAYFPFASGPRMCIGAHFAMTMAQLTLASIARRYRLRLAPGSSVEPEALITLRPRGSVDLMLEQV